MKKMTTLSGTVLRFIIPAAVLGLMIQLSSCTKTETNKPAPTVTVTPATATNLAGNAATATVHVDAPEGGKTLMILVNGAANSTLPDVALTGAAQDVPISFTIPATATVGAVYNLSFQAVDNKNQLSATGFFTVTVSSVAAKVIVSIPAGNIITNTTWTKDKIYLLNGFVRVGKDEPASGTVGPSNPPVISNPTTLTIEAGTVIYGAPAVGGPGGTLIIQRGSKLIANGTAAAPIIFTSNKAPGLRRPGDWGGVVLCGQAKQNDAIASGNPTGPGVDQLEGGYGGFFGQAPGSEIAADNSGSLKYVRIEYAGYPIQPNQEINGLTMGGVGSGTTLSYIQVTYANDDSFEWFGGTVNADHLIAYKGIDDDFDTDFGFGGRVQFGLAIRDAGIADQSGSNGFESDNNNVTTNDDPITNAKFVNMTIIGGKATAGTTLNAQFQNGVQIRRNSEMDLYNSFITGFPNGIYIDGNKPAASPQGSGSSVAKANSGLIELKNNLLAGVDGWGGNGFGRVAQTVTATALSLEDNTTVTPVTGVYPFSPNNEYNGSTAVPPRGRVIFAGDGAFTSSVFGLASGAGNSEQTITGLSPIAWFKLNNEIISKWTDSGLSLTVFDPLSGAPTFIPTAGSKLTTGGADYSSLGGGIVATNYRGAFGSTDWTLGWVNWNPGITDYSK